MNVVNINTHPSISAKQEFLSELHSAIATETSTAELYDLQFSLYNVNFHTGVAADLSPTQQLQYYATKPFGKIISINTNEKNELVLFCINLKNQIKSIHWESSTKRTVMLHPKTNYFNLVKLICKCNLNPLYFLPS